MKNSTKWITSAFAVVALFFATNVKAQMSASKDVWRLGVGVEGAVPTGNLSNFSNFALGGTVRLQYDGSSNISYILTTGYYNVFAKSVTVGTTSVTPDAYGIIPVKAGVKIFANPNFYFSGEAGVGIETSYAKSTKLILAPGVGYASDSGVDVGVRYENFSGQSNNYGLVALRVAYGFKL